MTVLGKKHAVVTAKTETLERATVKKALALMRDWSPPLGWRHPPPQSETAVAAADWGFHAPVIFFVLPWSWPTMQGEMVRLNC